MARDAGEISWHMQSKESAMGNEKGMIRVSDSLYIRRYTHERAETGPHPVHRDSRCMIRCRLDAGMAQQITDRRRRSEELCCRRTRSCMHKIERARFQDSLLSSRIKSLNMYHIIVSYSMIDNGTQLMPLNSANSAFRAALCRTYVTWQPLHRQDTKR